MPELQTEQVLVIPARVFHALGHFQGFCHDVEKYLDELLSPEHSRYLPRDMAEQDARYKQLIPYVVFEHTSPTGCVSVFQYTRGKGQGEARLHSKRSIGVGGHISITDAGDSGIHPYDDGLRRELDEEVLIETHCTEHCVGLINDDETEVGRVHLGIVHRFTVAEPLVRPRESEIIDSGFRDVCELLKQLDGFESWSQICLQALYGPVRP